MYCGVLIVTHTHPVFFGTEPLYSYIPHYSATVNVCSDKRETGSFDAEFNIILKMDTSITLSITKVFDLLSMI